MSHFFKNIFFVIANLFHRGLGDRASILMYHSIDTNEAFFSVTKKSFEQQIEYLVSQKVVFLRLPELIRRICAHESVAGCVCVTFDDGYKDNYMNAYPILKKFNIPSAIFLTTGTIGGALSLKSGISLPMLSLGEIREMRDSGLVEFFPHSVTHVKYNKDNLEKCVNEAHVSKQYVEQLFGEPVLVYAYPSGRLDSFFIEAVKKDGYIAAVTVEEGLVRLGDNLFTLKRNPVDSLTTMVQFKGKVSRSIITYLWLKNILK